MHLAEHVGLFKSIFTISILIVFNVNNYLIKLLLLNVNFFNKVCLIITFY